MPPLSMTLLTAVKLAVQNPLTPSCKTDGICLWWEKVCWEKASQMLPQGCQTSLLLRETQTALITNRPRSSLFFVGTGVSFALLATNNNNKKIWFWLSVHVIFGTTMSIIGQNLKIRCFGLYCGSQREMKRSKPRRWRGDGPSCTWCCSVEPQISLKDGRWQQPLAVISWHKPAWNQTEKD